VSEALYHAQGCLLRDVEVVGRGFLWVSRQRGLPGNSVSDCKGFPETHGPDAPLFYVRGFRFGPSRRCWCWRR